jgi:hypothetical protein
MSQMPEKEVIALIKAYRRRMLANGQPVKTVFALVALAGSGFPPDTCIAWGCLRSYVEGKCHELARKRDTQAAQPIRI